MDETAERDQPPAPWEPLLYPLPFALALVLRVWQLGAFATSAELAWAFRCARLWPALVQGKLGPPSGSVTLWLGSLGLSLRRSASYIPGLAVFPTFDAGNLALLHLVAPLWTSAALATAVVNAAVAMLVAILAARLWGARAGLFTALVLAFTPFYLALSRILGPDALTAALAVGAVLALLGAARRARSWALYILSGSLAGLALLNQEVAAILVPYGLFVLAVADLARRRSCLVWLRDSSLWLGALVLAAVLAYAATWRVPVAALRAVLAYLVGAMRFASRPWPAPGDLLALGLRLTPLSLAGLALAALRLPLDGGRRRWPLLGLLAFAAAFLLFAPGRSGLHGAGALTGILALDVAAAVGWEGLVTIPSRLLPARPRVALGASLALGAALLALLGWQAAWVVGYRPHYLAYRNPWLARWAPASAQAGWGEGMDLAAGYLNAQPQAQEALAATTDVAALAPFFVGETVPLSTASALSADYIVYYNRDWLLPGSPPVVPPQATPEQVVRLHGVEYARIYANRVYEPLLQLLASQAQADDVVLLDQTSPFARHYGGPAPYKEIAVQGEERLAAEINALAAGRWRLWHVAFAGADPHHAVRQLLESQAVLLQRQKLPGAEVSAYLLPLQVHFSPLVPSQEVGLRFTEALTLARAGLAAPQVQYRQKIALALEWHTDSRPDGNLALSLRLLDGQGRVWAQQDRWILDAAGHSTAAWEGGKAVRSLHTMAIPPGLPPGPYRLRGIVYLADTVVPLVPSGEAGPREGPEFDLSPLEVLPAQVPPAPAELKLEHPLQATLARGVEMLGYDIGAQTVQAGGKLPLRIWWRVTEPLTITYRAHLMLLDAGGDQRGDAIVELAGAERPTTTWTRGEVIEGRYSLGVSAEATGGQALVGVQLLAAQGPVGTAVRLEAVELTAFQHVFQPPPMQQRRFETLGQRVRLLGYDREQAGVQPGQPLRLTLYWQALAPMPANYTVAVRLLDPAGKECAGQDAVPAGGTRPTSTWLLHEVLTDPHELVVPADAKPGRYTIVVGLVDPASGARLPAYDSAGARLAQDRIVLGPVTVQ